MADINSTKGSPNANAYADTEKADDYLESVYGSEELSSLTETAKEQLMMTATRMINRLKTAYPSSTTTQALKFPLNTGTDDDGYDKAAEATILQAIHIMKHSDEINEAEGYRIQGVTNEGIGSLSKSLSGFNPLGMFSPEAIMILSPYIDMRVKGQR